MAEIMSTSLFGHSSHVVFGVDMVDGVRAECRMSSDSPVAVPTVSSVPRSGCSASVSLAVASAASVHPESGVVSSRSASSVSVVVSVACLSFEGSLWWTVNGVWAASSVSSVSVVSFPVVS